MGREEEFIRKLAKWRLFSDPWLLKGIGDDSAIYGDLLVSKDIFVENVHFSFSYLTPYEVGRKALLSNISDIAAMGGFPLSFLLGLSFDGDEFIFSEFTEGLKKVADEWGINLIGGDISESPGPFFASITIFGKSEKPVMRDRGNTGDIVCVTGTLGDSSLGLEVIKKGLSRDYPYLTMRHKEPTPRVREGILLSHIANSMIDISDGLLLDLYRLLGMGRLGFIVNVDAIPLSEEFKTAVKDLKYNDPLSFALYGGEDYELLFTVPKENIEKLYDLPFPVSIIGEVVEKGYYLKVNGSLKPIEIKGYEHF